MTRHGVDIGRWAGRPWAGALQPAARRADETTTTIDDLEAVLTPPSDTDMVAFAASAAGEDERAPDPAPERADEPEPWVGWAHGTPVEEPEPPAADIHAYAPQPSTSARTDPPAPQSSGAPAVDEPPAPSPSTVPPTADDPAPPTRTPLDEGTRRELFSALHDVGRAAPASAPSTPDTPGPPSDDPGPRASDAGTEPVVDRDAETEVDDGTEPAAPAASPLSGADVSELLRELHSLSVDGEPAAGASSAAPSEVAAPEASSGDPASGTRPGPPPARQADADSQRRRRGLFGRG